MNPRIGFRVANSPGVGSGHVMRCRALAQALERRGATVIYAGAGEENSLRGQSLDWLVVDDYALDVRWEMGMRPFARQIAVIDDLADRFHDCDLLLDQNFFSAPEQRYQALLSEQARTMLGPRYALLRQEFVDARGAPRRRDGTIRRILVSFGGVDAQDHTSRAINAIRALGRAEIGVDVVVGADNPNGAAIERQCATLPGFRFHRQASNMAELMTAADLSVGAGGSTTWERCCLGLPSIQTAISPDQDAPSRALADAGMVTYLGPAAPEQHIREALLAALAQPEGLVQQSIRVSALVDGRGAWRAAAAFFVKQGMPLDLRSATMDDARLYFEWANDSDVRRYSFDQRPIDWASHEKWFGARLGDAILLVAQDEDAVPIGQVRFEFHGGHWRVNYSVGREFRNAGLGERMMRLAITELRRRQPGARLVADVSRANASSCRVFVVIGFAVNAAAGDDHLHFELP